MFHHILVPLDGSPLAESVLPHVMATAHAFGARVTLARVLECPGGDAAAVDPFDWQMCKLEALRYLETLAEQFADDAISTATLLLEGRPAEAIVNTVHNNGFDLVVLSSHGASGLSAWNVSSVVQKVIQRVHCSVLLLRAYQPAAVDASGHRAPAIHYRRILLPLDGSLRAEHVLPVAQQLARAHNAETLLVHVIHKPVLPRRVPLTPEERALAEQLIACNRRTAEEYLARLQTHWVGTVRTAILVSDDIAYTLHGLVADEAIDLVILSAHGYSGKRRWPYGAVTGSFILYGATPLLFMQDLLPHERAIGLAEALAREQPEDGRTSSALRRRVAAVM
jgi:nucleotide-binding universal stress UspA family protein